MQTFPTFIGTSGFSYPAWRGSFYPEKCPPARMLAFYATRLGTVEINNTFYRMPKAETLRGWADTVPASFRFAPKAPQQITHRQKLVGSAEAVAFFFAATATLGERLGPTLFQLPPFLRKDLPRLQDFLALLPAGARAAFEFRHASWFSDDVYEALRARGAALCLAEAEDLATPVVPTTSWGYLRLRRADYDEAGLALWAQRLRDQSGTWSEAFVYFKHEDGARGPKLAARLGQLLAGGGGDPISAPEPVSVE
ncbi:MAG: DUF72 domain-containing protein [Myxococcales bacterium]